MPSDTSWVVGTPWGPVGIVKEGLYLLLRQQSWVIANGGKLGVGVVVKRGLSFSRYARRSSTVVKPTTTASLAPSLHALPHLPSSVPGTPAPLGLRYVLLSRREQK